MRNKNLILAVILARKNSKRLPKKNHKNFLGKPLVWWTAKAATESKSFDRIFCFTDDENVKKICGQHGIDTSLKRNRSISGPKVGSYETVKIFMSILKKKYNYNPEWIVMLQPTSPLRNSMHIKNAIKKIKNSKYDSLISLRKIKSSVANIRFYKNGYISKLDNYMDFTKKKYQSINDIYEANGAIYAIRCSVLEKNSSFDTKKTAGFVMDDDASIDIDNQEEFTLAEKILR